MSKVNQLIKMKMVLHNQVYQPSQVIYRNKQQSYHTNQRIKHLWLQNNFETQIISNLFITFNVLPFYN